MRVLIFITFISLVFALTPLNRLVNQANIQKHQNVKSIEDNIDSETKESMRFGNIH